MSRFATACSSLDLFVVPAGNLIFELYCKGHDAAKLHKALSHFLKAKAPLFPSCLSHPVRSLNWTTTTAISFRVSHLWDNGMPTHDLRNRRLNLPEPSARPLVPPLPHHPGSLLAQWVAERRRVFRLGAFQVEGGDVGLEEFAGGGGGFPIVEAIRVVGKATVCEGLGQGGVTHGAVNSTRTTKQT